MNTTTPKVTAAQEIILAASDLAKSGHSEFSEWELIIAAWCKRWEIHPSVL
jgi:hypothetical protein